MLVDTSQWIGRYIALVLLFKKISPKLTDRTVRDRLYLAEFFSE
jgi:hypothetical protein